MKLMRMLTIEPIYWLLGYCKTLFVNMVNEVQTLSYTRQPIEFSFLTPPVVGAI
jgi:hypothetical protein